MMIFKDSEDTDYLAGARLAAGAQEG